MNPDVDPLEVSSIVRSRAEGRLPAIDDFAERLLGDETLTVSTGMDGSIERILASCSAEGAIDRARQNVRMVLDEMLTNAFYQAPRDADGTAPFATRKRSDPVTLPEGKNVRVRWGVRGDELVVEVRDSYGSFSESGVVESLQRGLAAGSADLAFRESSAGAGMGLFMTFQGATRLFIGIDRTQCTSMLCILDLKARRRAMAEWVRSLHVIEIDRSRDTVVRMAPVAAAT